MRRGVVVGGLVAVVLGVGAVAALQARPGGADPRNPGEGLSDAERMAQIAEATGEYLDRLHEWYAELDSASIDFRALERKDLGAHYDVPVQTIDQSVRAADAIVHGRVTETRVIKWGAVVTVAVEDWIKGEGGRSQVTIRQGSMVYPGMNWMGMVIIDAENEPLLLPGDEVILLLETSPLPEGEYTIQSFTGHYVVSSDRVVALPMNPFASAVMGQPPARFVEHLAALVRGRQ